MTTVCAAGNGAHLKLVDGSPAHLNRGAELEEAGRFVSVVEGAAAVRLKSPRAGGFDRGGAAGREVSRWPTASRVLDVPRIESRGNHTRGGMAPGPVPPGLDDGAGGVTLSPVSGESRCACSCSTRDSSVVPSRHVAWRGPVVTST